MFVIHLSYIYYSYIIHRNLYILHLYSKCHTNITQYTKTAVVYQNLTMKKVAVLNIRLPDEIISWLDVLVEKKIYNSRSEAVREFSRDYVIRNRGSR